MTALRETVEANHHLPPFSDQHLSAVLREMGWQKSVRCRLEGYRHQFWINGVVPDPKKTAEERLEIL